MCRAAEAGVVGPNQRFHAIEHARGQALAAYEMLRYLQDPAIHGHIVVPCGDDHIGPLNQALLINLVVVEESAGRSFAASHAFFTVGAGNGTYMFR